MRELRKFQRVALPHRIDLACGGRSHQGHLENLSMNGALVELTDGVAIALGQPCMLCIHPDEQSQDRSPLLLRCEAIHGSSSLVGMRFVECDGEARHRLLQLVQRMTSNPDTLEDDLDRIRGYLAEYRSAL